MTLNSPSAARKVIRQITRALDTHTSRRFYATFVDRFVPSTFHGQKRALREHLGLLRPVRCPGCRMFTKQKRVMTDIRQCLSCRGEFTFRAARKGGQREGARWANR